MSERAAETSFDSFVATEYEQVIALALAALADSDDAVEVAQETMARTFERWGTVSQMDRPGAWSRRVALNLVTDRLRGRTRRRRLRERLRNQPTTTPVDPVASGAGEWDRAFWAHVAALPRRQRDVVVLHYVEDLPIAEIAEIVEAPTGTVKSDLSRARVRLREQLGDRAERLGDEAEPPRDRAERPRDRADHRRPDEPDGSDR